MSQVTNWNLWPLDVWVGYAAVGLFPMGAALATGFSAQNGPSLFPLWDATMLGPFMILVALVLAVRIIIGPRRLVRIVPLMLASVCISISAELPEIAINLHVIRRVNLAGGAKAVNEWGQQLLWEQSGRKRPRIFRREELPADVRDHLPGVVTVVGTLWNDVPRLRIELGGGFYHYGVLVFPTGTIPPGESSLQKLGWPPDIIIYHE